MKEHLVLQRLSRLCQIHILAEIVLGMCITVPLAAQAHICLPRFGCPRIQPPNLTLALAIQTAEGYLSQNPPVIRFRLQKPVGRHPSAAYTDLARAGILHTVSGKAGEGSGPVYGLANNWEHEILEGFFRFTQVRTDDDVAYFIEIPVGSFRYVPGSAVLTRTDLRTSDLPMVTFKYQFIGNANAARLLRIGAPRDWVVDYAGTQFDLRKIGEVSKQTIILRPCHARWLAGPVPCP